MEVFSAEWPSGDLGGAVSLGFDYLEKQDHIVGYVHACPEVIKAIVLTVPEEVIFDFIPEGIGMIRTAYLKFKYGRTNELLFISQDKSTALKISLK